jgi:RNA polymerase sigma factor (TIGR02999 family)
MDTEEFSRQLDAWSKGDRGAGDRLYSTAYDDLKTIAHRCLRSHGRGAQLSTTVLVNECYLKLATSGVVGSENREHFLALCARAMRQIIVDSARRELAGKRNAQDEFDHLCVESTLLHAPLSPESVAALDQALTGLDAREPRLARIAECRIFADMSSEDIARALDVNERTVQREWLRIKALLSVILE